MNKYRYILNVTQKKPIDFKTGTQLLKC